jgi:glutamate-1-semialdehyde 2,1-aminomutase
MPLAAYGGRRDIMEKVAPLGPVYQAGTLSGNPIATTAGIKTLQILMSDSKIYDTIELETRKLAEAAAKSGRVSVNHVGSLMSIFFTKEPVTDYDSALTSDTKQYAEYFSYLLSHGIYVAPSQFEAMFISYAHTKEEIAHTCAVLEEALKKLEV